MAYSLVVNNGSRLTVLIRFDVWVYQLHLLKPVHRIKAWWFVVWSREQLSCISNLLLHVWSSRSGVIVAGRFVQRCVRVATGSGPDMWPGAVCLQHCCSLVPVTLRTSTLCCFYIWLCWYWAVWTGQCGDALALLQWASLLWCRPVVLCADWMHTGCSYLSVLLSLQSPLSATVSVYPQGMLLLCCYLAGQHVWDMLVTLKLTVAGF